MLTPVTAASRRSVSSVTLKCGYARSTVSAPLVTTGIGSGDPEEAGS